MSNSTALYTDGKFNRSEIMKQAWKMVKNKPQYFNLSQALKIIWSQAKHQKLEADKQKERDEMSSEQLAESLGLEF